MTPQWTDRPHSARRQIYWGCVIFLLVLSQLAELVRPQIEAVFPPFQDFNRTQFITAVMLIALSVVSLAATWTKGKHLIELLRRAVEIVSILLVIYYIGLLVLPAVTLLSIDSFIHADHTAHERLRGLPSFETAFAALVVTRLVQQQENWLTSIRYFVLLGLTVYGLYELIVIDDKIFNFTEGTGMGPITVLFFIAFLFDFWYGQGRANAVRPNWRLGFFPAIFVFLALSWVTNIPKPDTVFEVGFVVVVFVLLLLGIRETLEFGYRNQQLAQEKTALADQILAQNNDLALIMSSMSHDLKSPIRNVRTLITMRGALKSSRGMTDEDIDKEQLRALKRIEDLSVAFVKFIRTRTEELNLHPVNVSDVVGELRDRYQTRVRLTVAMPEDATILADHDALSRVLENLIENTIQHGGRPDPEVLITYETADQQGSIRYEDNGQGIPPAARQRIFKPFETFEPKHKSGASGLGLSIIQRLIERMGGTITVTDPAQLTGACFVLKFQNGKVT